MEEKSGGERRKEYGRGIKLSKDKEKSFNKRGGEVDVKEMEETIVQSWRRRNVGDRKPEDREKFEWRERLEKERDFFY